MWQKLQFNLFVFLDNSNEDGLGVILILLFQSGSEKLVVEYTDLKWFFYPDGYSYMLAVGCFRKRFDICHGGCLHDGFLKSGDFHSKTFLCAAYKKIFAHIEKRMMEAGMG